MIFILALQIPRLLLKGVYRNWKIDILAVFKLFPKIFHVLIICNVYSIFLRLVSTGMVKNLFITINAKIHAFPLILSKVIPFSRFYATFSQNSKFFMLFTPVDNLFPGLIKFPDLSRFSKMWLPLVVHWRGKPYDQELVELDHLEYVGRHFCSKFS